MTQILQLSRALTWKFRQTPQAGLEHRGELPTQHGFVLEFSDDAPTELVAAVQPPEGCHRGDTGGAVHSWHAENQEFDRI